MTPKSPLALRLLRRLFVWLEQLNVRQSRIDTTPFLSYDTFPWTKKLEAHWVVIRDELQEVLQEREQIPNFQDILENQKSITCDDKWKTFILYGFGKKAHINCGLCPETTRLIESIPGMQTAFFSILAPGKTIPPHRGFYKGLIRYHLGLIVPREAPKCRIKVHDQYAHWEAGKSLIFDDTFTHQVWNDTEEERVILFLDIIRPLRFPWSPINRLALFLLRRIPDVQKATTNLKNWQKTKVLRPAKVANS